MLEQVFHLNSSVQAKGRASEKIDASMINLFVANHSHSLIPQLCGHEQCNISLQVRILLT